MSCTLDRSMLLLPLIVSVIVADAGVVHVGVTGVVDVGLIVAMAMAMAIAVTPRSLNKNLCDINVKYCYICIPRPACVIHFVALVATSVQKPPAKIRGQGTSKRGTPLARLRARWFELVDATPFPKGGGTLLLRYDYWNLCVRSFGEPSPESPIRGGGVWEIGLKAPPTRSCNGSRALMAGLSKSRDRGIDIVGLCSSPFVRPPWSVH